jgi:hypothetical protein
MPKNLQGLLNMPANTRKSLHPLLDFSRLNHDSKASLQAFIARIMDNHIKAKAGRYIQALPGMRAGPRRATHQCYKTRI